jgi:hypothetical protein
MCPKTRQSLQVDLRRGIAATADEKIKYPIIDGIIDFCSADKQQTYIAQLSLNLTTLFRRPTTNCLPARHLSRGYTIS